MLQVLDVGTIVAKVQEAGEASDARRIPVARDGDGLGGLVDLAVAGAADLQGLAQDFGCG